nr:MAG TPA_asm: hypothetical protein [Bacteriophage sp.]
MCNCRVVISFNSSSIYNSSITSIKYSITELVFAYRIYMIVIFYCWPPFSIFFNI